MVESTYKLDGNGTETKTMTTLSVPNWKNGSNILGLKVPAALEDTIQFPAKHSMAWFNQVMGGEGITPSQVTMFSGDPGIGKTTTMAQFADALTGAARCKESGKRVIVLLNTAEESLYQLRKVVKRLGLKSGFVAGQHKMLKDIIAHVDELQAENPDARIVVILDSLQVIDDGYYKDGGITSGTHQRVLDAVIDHAKKKWSTWFVICQVTKSGEAAGKNSLVHAGDCHLRFYYDRAKKSNTSGERLMSTTKNRFGSAGITYVLGMTSDGIYSKGALIDIMSGEDPTDGE